MAIYADQDISRNQLENLYRIVHNYYLSSGYARTQLDCLRTEFVKLKEFMDTKAVILYNHDIGREYCNERYKLVKNYSHQKQIQRIIEILNCIASGENIPLRIPKQHFISVCFRYIYESYIEHCKELGNSERTIYLKRWYLIRHLNILESLGCSDIHTIDETIVLKSALLESDHEAWKFIKLFLKFLCEAGVLEHNYAALVPTYRKQYHIPSTYCIEEIEIIEKTARDSTLVANPKRDYAIILLATRYGLRRGDICAFSFDSVNFGTNRLTIVQNKNHEHINLPLFPEVKLALLDYINNSRPDSSSNRVFIRARAPYIPLSPSGIYGIVSHIIEKSGIDTSGRKKGPHSLRASNTTLKINGGMSYAATRQSIGWRDPNIIQHYARLDIERLRHCAMEIIPAEVGSYFDRFLKGDLYETTVVQ